MTNQSPEIANYARKLQNQYLSQAKHRADGMVELPTDTWQYIEHLVRKIRHLAETGRE